MSRTNDFEPKRVNEWKANIRNGIDEYNRKVVIESETDDFIIGYFSEIDEYSYKHDKVTGIKRVAAQLKFQYRKKSLV